MLCVSSDLQRSLFELFKHFIYSFENLQKVQMLTDCSMFKLPMKVLHEIDMVLWLKRPSLKKYAVKNLLISQASWKRSWYRMIFLLFLSQGKSPQTMAKIVKLENWLKNTKDSLNVALCKVSFSGILFLLRRPNQSDHTFHSCCLSFGHSVDQTVECRRC